MYELCWTDALRSSRTSYLRHRISIDPRHFCSIAAVYQGGIDLLRVGVGGSCDDLNVHGHAGGEIHLVFVPDHFVKAKRVAAVVLPGYPEAYYRLQCFTGFGLVIAFSFSGYYSADPGIGDAEFAFFEFGTIKRLTMAD